MNYGQLKQAVLDYAHWPQLTTEVVSFIRLAEGLIARELRAAEMIQTATIVEADRVDGGIYALPDGFLEARSLWLEDVELTQVSLAELRRLRSGFSDTIWFAIRSGDEIEFRAAPATDTEIEIVFFERPATFTLDADENDVLTNHETIYLYAALHYLYTFTQDLELAQTALVTASDAIETLNQQAARHIGGARFTAAYNFTSRRSY